MRAIKLLPKGDAFMAMSEKGLETVTGGVTNEVREYAISRIGPSGRARREYAAAKAAGLKVIAKVQAGASWEFSSVPEIPVPALVRVLASRELKTAKETMAELCRDSRNAYERSNGYYYNLQDLREKILGCSLIAAGEG